MKNMLLLLPLVLLVGCGNYVAGKKLRSAVSKGDIEAIKKQLDDGDFINSKDEPGWTALHHAVSADWKGSHRGIVKLLIDRGANVRATCDCKETPLHLVSNRETAILLIEAGANVNAIGLFGGPDTILNSAARSASFAPPKTFKMYRDLIKVLIEKGANVNVSCRDLSPGLVNDWEARETALHAVSRPIREENVSEICDLLIAAGGKVNAKNSRDQTPLDVALKYERNKTGEKFRESGAKTSKELDAEGK